MDLVEPSKGDGGGGGGGGVVNVMCLCSLCPVPHFVFF